MAMHYVNMMHWGMHILVCLFEIHHFMSCLFGLGLYSLNMIIIVYIVYDLLLIQVSIYANKSHKI